MKKQKFEIEGYEILQKKVVHYPKQASRIYVPITWKNVIIVRVD